MEQRPSAANYPVAEVGEIELTGLRAPRSPRAWALRLALVALALALGLAVPLGGLAALREQAVALLRPTPPALPALPGASSFYFLPAPSWVSVWVDGQRLGEVPLADGAAPPLRLARGTHHIEWLGSPFNQPRCALVVPIPFIYRPGPSACAIQPYLGRPAGYVLHYRESLGTLSSQQQTALGKAIAAGLIGPFPSAVLAAGRPYLLPDAGAPSGFRLATAPVALLATPSFTFDPNPPWSEPCAESGGTYQPCRFSDQDCRLLCTMPATNPRNIGWLVAVPARASWTLTTLDGDPAGTAATGPRQADVLVVMQLTWDGYGWHAPPIFGHAAGGAVADDAVCAPARDWLANGAAQLGAAPGPLVPGGPALLGEGEGAVTYASDYDPTDGCAVSVPLGALAVTPPPALTQPPRFLLRFGVLLAVNDAAHQVAPGLPLADADEQAIAQRLLSPLADAATRTITDLDADGRY